MEIASNKQVNSSALTDRSDSKRNYICVLIIALLTLLPLSTMGNLLRLGVAGVLFLFKDRTNSKLHSKMPPMFLAMITGNDNRHFLIVYHGSIGRRIRKLFGDYA